MTEHSSTIKNLKSPCYTQHGWISNALWEVKRDKLKSYKLMIHTFESKGVASKGKSLVQIHRSDLKPVGSPPRWQWNHHIQSSPRISRPHSQENMGQESHVLHYRITGFLLPGVNPIFQCRSDHGTPTTCLEIQLLERSLSRNNCILVSEVLLRQPRSGFEKQRNICGDI